MRPFNFCSRKITKGPDWYNEVWKERSAWCTAIYGWGHWEFFDNRFVFKRAEDLTLYTLRWE